MPYNALCTFWWQVAYLNDCALGEDPKRCVEWGSGVLLHANDGQAKCGLQLGVGHMGLVVTQALKVVDMWFKYPS